MLKYRLSEDHMIEITVNPANFIVTFYELTAGEWRRLNEETWHSFEDIAEEYGIDAPTEKEIEARQAIAEQFTGDLLDEFELTTDKETTLEVATVRGWIMDEIESRYPEAFDKWLDAYADDSKLKYYIMEG